MRACTRKLDKNKLLIYINGLYKHIEITRHKCYI